MENDISKDTRANEIADQWINEMAAAGLSSQDMLDCFEMAKAKYEQLVTSKQETSN